MFRLLGPAMLVALVATVLVFSSAVEQAPPGTPVAVQWATLECIPFPPPTAPEVQSALPVARCNEVTYGLARMDRITIPEC